MTSNRPTDDQAFQAVLLIAFGGPERMEDVRPFLANVLRGRRVPPERLEEVVRHYALFGGRSPLTEATRRQASQLQDRLAKAGLALPVYVGMRNWHPFLADTLAEMSGAGIRQAIGLIAAAHQCYSSCQQYRENVAEARRLLRERSLPDVQVTYLASWHDNPAFVEAISEAVSSAAEKLRPADQRQARVIFTAHSIPVEQARQCRYAEQLVTTARLVAEQLRLDDWAVVYQSRSGRPQGTWLEPDILDYLRQHAGKSLESAILAPIGFLSDHIEVLYDLDYDAGQLCRELGIPMVRAQTVGEHPRLLDGLAKLIIQTCERYRGWPVLPITAG